jgi:hypothetical protein
LAANEQVLNIFGDWIKLGNLRYAQMVFYGKKKALMPSYIKALFILQKYLPNFARQRHPKPQKQAHATKRNP